MCHGHAKRMRSDGGWLVENPSLGLRVVLRTGGMKDDQLFHRVFYSFSYRLNTRYSLLCGFSLKSLAGGRSYYPIHLSLLFCQLSILFLDNRVNGGWY